MTLPRAVAVTSGVQLTTVDILPLTGSATADATGTAVVTFEAVDGGYLWLIGAMSVRASTGVQTAARATVWAGPRLMDGSNSGGFDFSDRSTPILVNSNESLTVQWTGATPGTKFTVDAQYQLIKRGA